MHMAKNNQMEQIDIHSDNSVVSRIMISESVDALKECIDSYAHVFAIMDAELARRCPAAAEVGHVLNERKIPGMLLEASEKNKVMDTVVQVCTWLMEQGADRDAFILAVGGGVTTDIVGFAASIYKRGVRYASVPTTLLAQVDACVGGKNGVNFMGYKNMLGTITQPEFTFVCPEFLASLPKRDFLSGAAEMIKAFIIEDKGHYERAVMFLKGYSASEDTESYLMDKRVELQYLVSAAVKVKAGIVSRDCYERCERRLLNLGHTFAHAVETLAFQQGYDISHGEAVSIGMIMAAELAEQRSITDPLVGEAFGKCLSRKLEDDFFECGFRICSPFGIKSMAEVMTRDKKAYDGKICFILPCDIGNVMMLYLSVDEVVELLS